MTRSPRTVPRVTAGLALAGAAVFVTACGASSPPAAPPATTAPAAGSTSASPAPAASSAPATGATTSQATAACPTSSLQATTGLSQGTAGSIYVAVDFKNISGVTCTLYGYPGVSLAGGKPVTQIGSAASEVASPPRQLVALAPGAFANATLQVVDAGNFGNSRCGPVSATYLQVYPPNQTTPIYVAYHAEACSKHAVGLLRVTVVQPGSGGNS